MLFYGCLYIGVSGPLIQYLKTFKNFKGVKYNTCVQPCVYSHTHTCGARAVVTHCLIGGPTSLGGQSGERGGNISPYYEIRAN